MGIDLYIGQEQIRITNAYWYNKFLNWVAEIGDFPYILDHSPIHGSYSLNKDEPASEYSGSVQGLKKELEELAEANPPERVEDIVSYMLEGCRIALETRTKITMDNGAWEDEFNDDL